MVGYRQTIDMGDDVIAQGTVISQNEDYLFVGIEAKRDENFLGIIPYGVMSISGRGSVTVPVVDPDDPMEHACGMFKSGWVNDLDHYRPKRFTCHLQGCPECFRIWARRQAESAAGYLWAFTRKYGREIAHWVLSPSIQKVAEFGSDGWGLWKWLDGQLRLFINQFGEFAKTIVAPIRHPMRKKCPICNIVSEDGVHCKQCDVDMVWYWSPHLHVSSDFRFDYARAVEYAAFENQQQCIFTQVSVPPSQEELANQIAYELGHALYVDGKSLQAIRYMGFCAKNHFRTEKHICHTEAGEPEIRLDGSCDNHTFYKIQDQCVFEAKPGVLQVKKGPDGRPYLARDISGDLIPLQQTTWYYELTELGQWLNGRWVRFTLPRKLKKPSCHDRQVWDTISWEHRFLNV